MTSNEQADPRVLGRLKSVDGQGTVVIQDRFAAAVDTVWKALTDKTELAHWLGDFTGDLTAGRTHHSRFHASGAEGDSRIDACEAPNHFRVTRIEDTGEDGNVIDATLKADGGDTILAVTQSHLPVRWIAAFGAGLQIHVEDLGLHLAGKERSQSDARMDALVPLYEEQGVTEG
ncbi:MAG: SRPBCC domain-containing protein [Humibacillus sp.]|nr:SRPBCC domain-containing protein [Humibacillus sp.]MDN5775424.1 SRPBCC domain-containing protein [Humibacillus sp.]